jgi:hypothetical protein
LQILEVVSSAMLTFVDSSSEIPAKSLFPQLSEIGTSAGHGQHDLRADGFSVGGGYVCGDEINLECQTVEVAPTRDRHIGLSQIRDVANDWVLAVACVSKKALREHFVAVIIKLTEVVKGDVDAVQGMSLENVLDRHLSTNIPLRNKSYFLATLRSGKEPQWMLRAPPAKWNVPGKK